MWICAMVRCSRCGAEWVAVYAWYCDELECLRCGYLDPILPEGEAHVA